MALARLDLGHFHCKISSEGVSSTVTTVPASGLTHQCSRYQKSRRLWRAVGFSET
jgi:hypothetical protein